MLILSKKNIKTEEVSLYSSAKTAMFQLLLMLFNKFSKQKMFQNFFLLALLEKTINNPEKKDLFLPFISPLGF